jgi:hypothetical protein
LGSSRWHSPKQRYLHDGKACPLSVVLAFGPTGRSLSETAGDSKRRAVRPPIRFGEDPRHSCTTAWQCTLDSRTASVGSGVRAIGQVLPAVVRVSPGGHDAPTCRRSQSRQDIQVAGREMPVPSTEYHEALNEDLWPPNGSRLTLPLEPARIQRGMECDLSASRCSCRERDTASLSGAEPTSSRAI